MDKLFHTATFVAEFMAAAIEHCRLVGPEGSGLLATLANDHCVILLENVDNDYVRFEFHRPGTTTPKWELASYLNCRFMAQGGAFRLRPKPARELSHQEKFEWYLKRYDEVMVLGYLDAPLAGDYSWEEDYSAHDAEFRRLSSILTDLKESGHPEGKRLMWKMLDGDRSWMDEVRGLLEQNSQDSQDSQD